MSQPNINYNNERSYKNRDRKGSLLFLKRNSHVVDENEEIILILDSLKDDLNYVHNCLDYITDPILIDSYIYQLQSLNMKYKFYIQLCKERGLISE